MTPELLWLAAMFSFVMAAVSVAGYWWQRRAAEADSPQEAAVDPLPRPPLTVLTGALHTMGETLRASQDDSEETRKQLLNAGYRSPAAVPVFYGLRGAAALAFAAVASWVVLWIKAEPSATLLPALCAAGFGFLMPARLVALQIRRRARRIRSGLPAVLDLLVLTVESGQSLDQAFHDTAYMLQNIYPELCAELLFSHLEMRAGTSRHDALRHLADRSAEPELARLAALFVDADRFGSSLGPALRTHTRYLRTRLRQQAQEKARKLSVKLVFPVFFLIFPSVLLVTLGPAVLQFRNFFGQFVGN